MAFQLCVSRSLSYECGPGQLQIQSHQTNCIPVTIQAFTLQAINNIYKTTNNNIWQVKSNILISIQRKDSFKRQ